MTRPRRGGPTPGPGGAAARVAARPRPAPGAGSGRVPRGCALVVGAPGDAWAGHGDRRSGEPQPSGAGERSLCGAGKPQHPGPGSERRRRLGRSRWGRARAGGRRAADAGTSPDGRTGARVRRVVGRVRPGARPRLGPGVGGAAPSSPGARGARGRPRRRVIGRAAAGGCRRASPGWRRRGAARPTRHSRRPHCGSGGDRPTSGSPGPLSGRGAAGGISDAETSPDERSDARGRRAVGRVRPGNRRPPAPARSVRGGTLGVGGSGGAWSGRGGGCRSGEPQRVGAGQHPLCGVGEAQRCRPADHGDPTAAPAGTADRGLAGAALGPGAGGVSDVGMSPDGRIGARGRRGVRGRRPTTGRVRDSGSEVRAAVPWLEEPAARGGAAAATGALTGGTRRGTADEPRAASARRSACDPPTTVPGRGSADRGLAGAARGPGAAGVQASRTRRPVASDS